MSVIACLFYYLYNIVPGLLMLQPVIHKEMLTYQRQCKLHWAALRNGERKNICLAKHCTVPETQCQLDMFVAKTTIWIVV